MVDEYDGGGFWGLVHAADLTRPAPAVKFATFRHAQIDTGLAGCPLEA